MVGNNNPLKVSWPDTAACGGRTEDDDEDVRQGEGEEVEVHGAVEAPAPSDHQDDEDVSQQAGDEDNHVEYCHQPEQSLSTTNHPGNASPLILNRA